jgi:YegS/Rv2252/BmrU family lipid kinase
MLRPFAALDAFDRRLFDRLTRQERRHADMMLRRLSHSANRSLLWLSIASAMAILGDSRTRRAALRGALSIGITSTLVNLPLKYLARRARPAIRRRDRPLPISMPGTFSFPSGHAASAFAFATGVALENPRFVWPILPLATGVAYSRVHLRVHYPFDVFAGAAIGIGMGLLSGSVIHNVSKWWTGLGSPPAAQRPQTTRLILVVSPHAGHEQKLDRARKAMAATGLEVAAEIPVSELKRLPELVRGAGPAPIVVAAGGDGTVGSVANALIGSGAVLGILPLGTSNDFARSLNIPMVVERSVRLLSQGRVSAVDAGRFTETGQSPRHFVHAAAAGLNVQFARLATRADLRERLGRLTYAVAAALALKDRPVFACDIEHDGGREQLQLIHLAVINAPVFGGFLDLKIPGATPDDRSLNVLMVEHLPMRRLIRSALYPAIGVHRKIRGLRILRVSSLTVRPPNSMDVTLDGEIAGKIPGRFDVVPGGLKVITPAGFGNNHR